MDPDSTPVQRSGLKENLTGQELFIYDAQDQELTVLNRSAIMIWSMCDRTHNLAQMLDVLSTIYPDADANVLRDDTLLCLTSFAEQELIVLHSSPQAAD